MKTIGTRIREERNRQKMSQEQLAKKAGVTQGTIAQQEDMRIKRSKHLPEIAAALGVPLNTILYDTDRQKERITTEINVASPTAIYETDERFVYIPVYELSAALGNGRVAQHEQVSGKHSYSLKWLSQEKLNAKNLSRIKGEGRSMEPTINDGDTLLINHEEKSIIPGKVFMLRIGNETRIKRLYLQLDGRIRVVSDNIDKFQYPDEFVYPNEMPEIIGRVRDVSSTWGL